MTPSASINKWLGKPVEVEDARALDQCMDWAFQFVDDIGVPGGHGTIRAAAAKDVWNKYDKNQYDKVDTPQQGDLAIWGTGVGPYGHIAVVNGGTRSNFTSADQNWNGVQKVLFTNHNASGLLGFLRPKILAGASMPYSDRQFTDAKAAAINFLYFAYHDRGATEADVKTWLNTDIPVLEDRLRNPDDPISGEHREIIKGYFKTFFGREYGKKNPDGSPQVSEQEIRDRTRQNNVQIKKEFENSAEHKAYMKGR